MNTANKKPIDWAAIFIVVGGIVVEAAAYVALKAAALPFDELRITAAALGH